MGASKRNHSTRIAVGGAVIVALVLILGTVWMGRSAKEGTETAVHSVSLLYLEELAGRREQVVEDSLKSDINVIQTAVSLMTEDALRDMERLQAYQARMKRLFRLEKFAFVDRNGVVFIGAETSLKPTPRRSAAPAPWLPARTSRGCRAFFSRSGFC